MISNKVREARKESGLTVSELARRVGRSRQFVSLVDLNKKQPSAELMLRICIELDCDPREIFFEECAIQ